MAFKASEKNSFDSSFSLILLRPWTTTTYLIVLLISNSGSVRILLVILFYWFFGRPELQENWKTDLLVREKSDGLLSERRFVNSFAVVVSNLSVKLVQALMKTVIVITIELSFRIVFFNFHYNFVSFV